MRRTREPFFGMPEDRVLLAGSPEPVSFEFSEPVREFVEPGSPLAELLPKPPHPDAVEKGIELPLGFHQHQGESRTTRRAAVATWQPPKVEGEKPPTRRELWQQRQRQRRGKLDPELRRLQRERLNQK
jgi:hypothetical protein